MGSSAGRLRRAVVALVIVVGALAGMPAAVTAAPVIVSDAPGPQSVARTDGVFVVWQDGADFPDSNLYGARLDDGQVFAIDVGPRNAFGAAIDAGRVVWVASDASGADDVRGRNLVTGADFDVAATAADEGQPAISGKWAAWVSFDWTTSKTTLLARDIDSMAGPITVAEPLPDSESIWDVEMDGARVVWWEGYFRNSSYTWWLRAATIGGAPRTIARGSYYPPTFDVGGGIVVYSDTASVKAYDLATDSERVIDAADARGGPAQVWLPTTDGRYVFYQRDWNTDAGELRHELAGYDLATNSAFSVVADAGGHLLPDAAAGALAWQQGRDDMSDIYAAPIATLLPSAPRPAPNDNDPNIRYFPETGHTLIYGFKSYWESNGGLPVFGYPLTEEYQELNADAGQFQTSQYFERQRFEYHPENAGTPYEVELGRLGAELLTRQGRDWTAFPRADPAAPHYVPATGHAIAPEFWGYWSSHGLEFDDPGVSAREALALFGYPLSEPLMETNADGDTVLTQYFERAVFEYHPENTGTPYEVLLRRLGAEALAARGW